MTIYEEFIHYIEKNDVENVKSILKDKNLDPSEENNWSIKIACQYGYIDIVKLLLADKRIDPSNDNNWSIILAAQHDHIEIVKLLLNDKRVDPSDNENLAISLAKGNDEIVHLLWKDKRVKNTLDFDDPELYNELIRFNIKEKVENF